MSALAERVSAGGALEHDGVTVTIETIGPKTAEEMLRFNTRNRKLRAGRVKQYARMMALGKFGLADQAIGFDRDGVLIQGQHRLAAVVESAVPLTTMVMRGMVDEDKMNLDTGLVRRPSDVLAWRGEQSVFLLASSITFCWRYEQGIEFLRGGQVWPTAGDVVAWLEDHPDLRRSVKMGDTTRRGVRISPTALTVGHYLTAKVDEQDANEFMALVTSGEGLFDGDPILTLRRWADLRANAAERRTGQINTLVSAAVVLKAMNAWREGRTLKSLYWRSGGAQREAFPTVWVRT